MAGPLEHDARARSRSAAAYVGRAVDRHDVVECALAGDDERRRRDARAVGVRRRCVAISRARAGHPARARSARVDSVRSLRSANRRAARARREARRRSPAAAATASRRERAARRSTARAGRPDAAAAGAAAAPASTPGPARARALGCGRREPQRDQAAERDAADRRALEPARRVITLRSTCRRASLVEVVRALAAART